jgi:hypothetical protein
MGKDSFEYCEVFHKLNQLMTMKIFRQKKISEDMEEGERVLQCNNCEK